MNAESREFLKRSKRKTLVSYGAFVLAGLVSGAFFLAYFLLWTQAIAISGEVAHTEGYSGLTPAYDTCGTYVLEEENESESQLDTGWTSLFINLWVFVLSRAFSHPVPVYWAILDTLVRHGQHFALYGLLRPHIYHHFGGSGQIPRRRAHLRRV